ncbi:hypothetical protein [Bradyrhizobium sp. CCBAU 53421]|nr:hypothetical protein [Bradyrhizobium sp. CCBAU 53421]
MLHRPLRVTGLLVVVMSLRELSVSHRNDDALVPILMDGATHV